MENLASRKYTTNFFVFEWSAGQTRATLVPSKSIVAVMIMEDQLHEYQGLP